MKKVIVYGASGHGKVVADAAIAAGLSLMGFCDDDEKKRGESIMGWIVVTTGLDEVSAFCQREGCGIALGVGANRGRKELFDKLTERGIEIVTIVHPNATISPSARLGRGVVAFAGATVNPDSVVEDGVILNTACTVDHDNRIGAFAHLSPGVHLGGTVTVGEGTHIGIGASVNNNLVIGKWSVIGGGAAVVSDIPDHVVAVGVPARVLKKVTP